MVTVERTIMQSVVAAPEVHDRRRLQEIGRLHVFFASGALIEVRIARDAVDLGPNAAAD
jgi:hypothetical protein